MRAAHRLAVGKEVHLGRVSINGEDAIITRIPGSEGAGVELQNVELQISADSRFEGFPSTMPAVAWKHDLKSLRTVFHFGPGWLLFHVGGADEASETWIARWTLLDLFMLLVLSLAASRLWGLRWGLLLSLTLALTLTEEGAPTWLWAILLAFEGLCWTLSRERNDSKERSKPRERALRVLKVLWWVPFLVLMLVSLAYSLDELRFAINPSSQASSQPMAPYEAEQSQLIGNAAPAMEPSPKGKKVLLQEDQEAEEDLEEKVAEEGDMGPRKARGPGAYGGSSSSYGIKSRRYVPSGQNAQAAVQTGPGLPRWSGNSATLTWNGPVTQDEKLHLWMIPPSITRFLSSLRVALLFVLILFLIRRQLSAAAKQTLQNASAATLVLGALICMGFSLTYVPTALADIPPKEMLDELREHLKKPPACRPHCVALDKVEVRAEDNSISMRLRVAAQATSAFALPGRAESWLPSDVRLDGQSAKGLLQRNKRMYLRVPRGSHTVDLQGTLRGRDAFTIPMNARTPTVEAIGEGWQIEQRSGSGGTDSTLTLHRIQKAETGGDLSIGTSVAGANTTGPMSKETRTFPPLLRVIHTFSFGLTWEKQTRVERLTPLGASVAFSMKLLQGESVLTEGIEVEGGRIRAVLEADASILEWRSSLRKSPGFLLQAEDDGPLLHEWVLSTSPIWHVEFAGTKALHRNSSASTWRFRPWRGEKLKVKVTKPQIAKGSTRTFDHAELSVAPGSRSTETRLKLAMRSSRGGSLVLVLPKGAKGESLLVDGTERPMRQNSRQLNIASSPGRQSVEVRWREPRGVSLFTESSQVKISNKGSTHKIANLDVEVTPGAGRWVLFTAGPGMGPSVMFWAALLLVAIASLALSRISFVPLRYHQWFLFGIGLTQGPLWLSFILVGWFLAVGLRDKNRELPWWAFSSFQMLLLLWTMVALGGLITLVGQGLLGNPEMQIIGNGSGSQLLRWTTARAALRDTQSWFISVPILVYRGLMLAWALWLALSFLKWARWATSAFGRGGLFRMPPGFAPPFRGPRIEKSEPDQD